MWPPGGSDGSHDLTKAPGSDDVERQGIEERLDLLQAYLASCPLQGITGQVRPSGQLGKGDGPTKLKPK